MISLQLIQALPYHSKALLLSNDAITIAHVITHTPVTYEHCIAFFDFLNALANFKNAP